jgi:Cu2+-exporting ATPase
VGDIRGVAATSCDERDEAIGGAINGEGALTLEVRKTGDQTCLAQVIALVRQATPRPTR